MIKSILFASHEETKAAGFCVYKVSKKSNTQKHNVGRRWPGAGGTGKWGFVQWIQSFRFASSRDPLHKSVNILNIPELCNFKMNKMVNFMFYVF